MILVLGLVTLLTVANGGGSHSIKGRPTYGQRVVQEADLGGDAIPKPYSFSYDAGTPYVKSTREEVSDPSGRVEGTYTVSDPRGTARVVHYASDEGGFRADVHSSEPNIKTHSPANAQIVSVPGKGSFSGARHVLDPVSQAHDTFHSGIQQHAYDDPLYKIGLSQVPFGLSGHDYYSYPVGLYSPRRTVKTIVSSGSGGLGGIGGGRKGGVGGIGAAGVGPGNIHFTLGDPQGVKGFSGLGSSRPAYTIGQSPIPFGLSGLDYYSYPAGLYNQRGGAVKTVITKTSNGAGGLGGITALAGGRIKGGGHFGSGLGGGPGSIQFTLGDSSLNDPLYKIGPSQHPYGLSGSDYYSFPASMYAPRRTVKTVITKTSPGAGGLGGIGALGGGRKGGVSIGPGSGIAGSGPGNIQFTLGDSSGVKGFGGSAITDPLYSIGRSRVPFGLSGLDYYSYPTGLYSQKPRVKTVITKTSRGAGGLGGIADLAGGRGAGGFGPSNIQFTLGDPSAAKGFGGYSGNTYTIGRSRIPFGLSGSDYYSFPADMYNRGRTLTKISRGVGSGGIAAVARRLAAGNILDSQQETLADIDPSVSGLSGAPGSIQFTLGDSDLGPVKTVRKVIYRNGHSQVPYGLSGFDYYSYPSIMLSSAGRGFSGKATGGATSPFAGRLGGGSGGLLGNIQEDIAEQALTDPTFGGSGGSGIGQEKIVQVSHLGGVDDLGDQRSFYPGSIQFSLGDPSGFGRAYSIGRSQYPYGLSGLDYYSYPSHLQAPKRVKTIVKTTGLGGPGGIGQRTTVTKIETAGPGIGAQRQIQEKIVDPVLGGQAAIDPVLGGGPGNIQFTLGDPTISTGGIRAPAVVQEKVTVVNPADTGAGNIQFTLGDAGLGSFGGGSGDFGQRRISAGTFGSGVAGVAPGSIHFQLGDPQIGLRKHSQVSYIDSGLGSGRIAPVKKVQKQVIRTQDVGGIDGVTRLTRVTQKQATRANAGAGPIVEFTLGDTQLIGDPVGATGIRPSGGVSRVIQSKVVGTDAGVGQIAPGIQFTLGDSALVGGGRPVAVSPAKVIQEEVIADPLGGGVISKVQTRPVGGLRRIPVRRLSPSKLADLGTRPVRVAQQQVTRGAGGAGPIIEFSLGDRQIVGGGRPVSVGDVGIVGARTSPARIAQQQISRVVGPVQVSQDPVTQVELSGAGVGPAVEIFGDPSGTPVIDLARTSPARVVQEDVTGGQFTLGDSQILDDPSSAFGTGPLGTSTGRLTQDDISGGITRVTEIQQPIGLTSGGIGILRKKVISEKLLPRMSFGSRFPYDAPFDIYSSNYGGPGLVSKTSGYGLRTSAIRADPSLLGQQKITTIVDDGSGHPGVLQEKLGQVLVR